MRHSDESSAYAPQLDSGRSVCCNESARPTFDGAPGRLHAPIAVTSPVVSSQSVSHCAFPYDLQRAFVSVDSLQRKRRSDRMTSPVCDGEIP